MRSAISRFTTHTSTPRRRWFVVGWLFVLGAALGSFLNVVVYRLPRGMSLIRPGSRCPACQQAIRWHDNVPIVGWIVLGGRCRDCRAPISVRYPVVEALIACISAVLGWSEAVVEIPPPIAGMARAFAFDFGPYAFHLLLIYACRRGIDAL
jgi:leader peptidase (prepilin peptidase)/N-methyltransferase